MLGSQSLPTGAYKASTAELASQLVQWSLGVRLQESSLWILSLPNWDKAPGRPSCNLSACRRALPKLRLEHQASPGLLIL